MVKIENYNFPENLFYNDRYLWVKIEGNIATVGAAHFAAVESGEMSYIDFILREDSNVEIGKPFGSIESGKGATTLYAPISGTITQINADVESDPSLINKDCYEKGWIIKMTASNLSQDLAKLFKSPSPEFNKWLQSEITKSKAKKKELGIK